MRSPIHHTFAPHVNLRYALAAALLLIMPWRWRRGGAGKKLTTEIERRYGGKVFLFSSGREAMLALLRAMNLTAGEEIVLQGYTCVVLPNAVHAANGVPVYADIDPDTLNMTPDTVAPLLGNRTRAIVCQHTFGIPGPAQALKKIATGKKILLIEDCAHVLPDERGPDVIARHGDVILMSFGRDKAISGITGGALVVKNTDVVAALERSMRNINPLSYGLIARLLCYPILYFIARPFYGNGIGKAIMRMSRAIGLLPPILRDKEKEGTMDPQLHALPNACAALALRSLNKLEAMNNHRRALTSYYYDWCRRIGQPMLSGATPDLPLQKFPIFFAQANAMRAMLKEHNIFLDDGWTGCVICPGTSVSENANYEAGSDPLAEEVCRQIFSLPTHPTMSLEQAKILCAAVAAVGRAHDIG